MEGENTGFKDAPPLLPVVNEESASNAQNQNTDASVVRHFRKFPLLF